MRDHKNYVVAQATPKVKSFIILGFKGVLPVTGGIKKCPQ